MDESLKELQKESLEEFVEESWAEFLKISLEEILDSCTFFRVVLARIPRRFYGRTPEESLRGFLE